jgi:hypothetical protein
MSNPQQITIVRDTNDNPNDPMAQAMAEAATPQQPTTEEPSVSSERPTWLPEKFQNPEDLAKAYSELEKKFSETTPVKFDGLEKYTEEFEKNGDLSDESIKAIAAMGIPEPIVRAYVDGQKSVVESNVSAVFNLAGGQDKYQELLSWAGENIPEDEVDAFNAVIDSGNMNTIKMAVQGLRARFERANGQGGRLIQGETTGPSGGAFRSIAEIVSAMKDPRYATDPAYRSDVEKRVALSNALGVK